jgi:hypothetical protein
MASDWTEAGAVGGRYGEVRIVIDGATVLLQTSGGVHVALDGAKQEEFGQLYVAACNRAAIVNATEPQAEVPDGE